jgi:hypothetical protein
MIGAHEELKQRSLVRTTYVGSYILKEPTNQSAHHHDSGARLSLLSITRNNNNGLISRLKPMYSYGLQGFGSRKEDQFCIRCLLRLGSWAWNEGRSRSGKGARFARSVRTGSQYHMYIIIIGRWEEERILKEGRGFRILDPFCLRYRL